MTGVPRSEWGNQAQWAATAVLLGLSLAGESWALPLALSLCAASTVYYAARLRSLRAYRVQIRLGFLGIAGLGALPGLAPILWLPLLGTTSQVLFGICPMARSLALMPWNRSGALGWRGFAAALTRPPGAEGLLVRQRAKPTGSLTRNDTAAAGEPISG